MTNETIKNLEQINKKITQYNDGIISELHSTNEAVNLLRQEVAGIRNASVEIGEGIRSLQQRGLNANDLIPALSGLLGVLLGGFIAYYFSKRLSDSNNKARVAIQRRNLIFSKLYKELRPLKEALSSLPQGYFYTRIRTNAIKTDDTRDHREYIYIGDKRYPVGSFYLWNEMKHDIRKTQIPERIRNDLARVEGTLIAYFTASEDFKEQTKTVEKNEGKRMIEIYHQNLGRQDTIFHIDFEMASREDTAAQEIVDSTVKRYALPNTPEFLSEMKRIVEIVLALPSLDSMKTHFKSLVSNVDTAVSSIETLVQYITDEYEYGESL